MIRASSPPPPRLTVVLSSSAFFQRHLQTPCAPPPLLFSTTPLCISARALSILRPCTIALHTPPRCNALPDRVRFPSRAKALVESHLPPPPPICAPSFTPPPLPPPIATFAPSDLALAQPPLHWRVCGSADFTSVATLFQDLAAVRGLHAPFLFLDFSPLLSAALSVWPRPPTPCSPCPGAGAFLLARVLPPHPGIPALLDPGMPCAALPPLALRAAASRRLPPVHPAPPFLLPTSRNEMSARLAPSFCTDPLPQTLHLHRVATSHCLAGPFVPLACERLRPDRPSRERCPDRAHSATGEEDAESGASSHLAGACAKPGLVGGLSERRPAPKRRSALRPASPPLPRFSAVPVSRFRRPTARRARRRARAAKRAAHIALRVEARRTSRPYVRNAHRTSCACSHRAVRVHLIARRTAVLAAVVELIWPRARGPAASSGLGGARARPPAEIVTDFCADCSHGDPHGAAAVPRQVSRRGALRRGPRTGRCVCLVGGVRETHRGPWALRWRLVLSQPRFGVRAVCAAVCSMFLAGQISHVADRGTCGAPLPVARARPGFASLASSPPPSPSRSRSPFSTPRPPRGAAAQPTGPGPGIGRARRGERRAARCARGGRSISVWFGAILDEHALKGWAWGSRGAGRLGDAEAFAWCGGWIGGGCAWRRIRGRVEAGRRGKGREKRGAGGGAGGRAEARPPGDDGKRDGKRDGWNARLSRRSVWGGGAFGGGARRAASWSV